MAISPKNAVKAPKTPKRSRKSATPTELVAPDERASNSIRQKVNAYKKELIFQAACETFYESGYHETTVDMITERVSGSKAIFYYNYADKHAVLEAIYKKSLTAAQAVIQAAMDAGGTPTIMLSTFARHYAEWVIDNQLMVGVFWREERCLSKEARAAVAVEQKRFDDMLARIINSGAVSGDFSVDDVQTTSRAISGMISFTYTWWRSGRRLSRHDAADYYARMALRLAGCTGAPEAAEPADAVMRRSLPRSAS